MVGAVNSRNLDGLMDPIASGARVSITGRSVARSVGPAEFRQTIAAALPFLSDFVWDAQVGQSVIDPKTGAVRLRVRSTYSAKLAEPVGVTSASLEKPAELVSAHKRIAEAFNTSAEEIYEFRGGPSGKLEVAEIVSAVRRRPTAFSSPRRFRSVRV